MLVVAVLTVRRRIADDSERILERSTAIWIARMTQDKLRVHENLYKSVTIKHKAPLLAASIVTVKAGICVRGPLERKTTGSLDIGSTNIELLCPPQKRRPNTST